MINFKLVIPGNAIVKKNTTGQLWFRTVKDGGLVRKIPLAVPIVYYSEAYQNWAKQAVQTLGVFKSNLFLSNGKLPDENILRLPISEPIIVTYVFFISDKRRVDLSNLIEAPQDVLAGNAGNFLDAHRTVNKEKITIQYDHTKYQIIADDNREIVKNYGGSTIMYDPRSPRTEIFISSFDLSKWKQVMDACHPDLKLGAVSETPQLNLDLGSLYEGIL